MTYPTRNALRAVEYKDAPGLRGRTSYFIRHLPAACGPDLWDAYAADGYLPGDLVVPTVVPAVSNI